MKHGYKLLGVIWDNLDTSTTISYLDNNIFINDISSEYNLFDINNFRKVSITDILKIENENELKILLNKMNNFNSILIDVDYFPKNDNKILINFYLKRVNQIYNYFSNKLSNTKIYLSNNYNEYLNKFNKDN